MFIYKNSAAGIESRPLHAFAFIILTKAIRNWMNGMYNEIHIIAKAAAVPLLIILAFVLLNVNQKMSMYKLTTATAVILRLPIICVLYGKLP